MSRGSVPLGEASGADSLFEVIWRRRLVLLIVAGASLVCGALYLAVATPVYRSAAEVYVQQGGPQLIGDRQSAMVVSDDFLYTQAEVFQSAPVLSRALATLDYRSLRTFASVTGDPVEWLKHSGALQVDVAKKGAVLTVSMDSPYPHEAAAIVNAVVQSFITEQTRQKQGTGAEMVKILRGEEAELKRKHDDTVAAMLKLKQSSGVLSFGTGQENIALTRLAALSTSLTTAQLATIDLRSQLESAKSMLSNPKAMAAYAEAQQGKGQNGGDKEYEDLRTQLSQLLLTGTAENSMMGANNPRVRAVAADIEMLKKRIVEKQRSMAEAHVQDLATQVEVAQKRESDLRTTLDADRKLALAMDPKAVEYAKLESNAQQLQKQLDQLDARISEISANTSGTGALNIQVVESAHAPVRPLRPRKSLVLAAALLAGVLLGAGACLLQEWKDNRLRKPEELAPTLGVPLIGMVPRVAQELSVVEHGQLVRRDPGSPAAEAYRALRTAIHFGAVPDLKTIAVVSPLPGDGKSTTASNLAIALAEAGHRTLLIDCDLRRPVQHAIFELKPKAGLATVLSGQAKLRDVILTTTVPGLCVLPCGPVPRNPSELVSGKRFEQVLQAVGTAFDRIVIDSPPLAAVSDGRVLAASADATLIVIRMNQSVREVSVAAIDGLQSVGANILGAVANEVTLGREFATYYGDAQPTSVIRVNRRLMPPAGRGGAEPGRHAAPGADHFLPADALDLDVPEWASDTQ